MTRRSSSRTEEKPILPESVQGFSEQGLSVEIPLPRVSPGIGDSGFGETLAVVGRADLREGRPSGIAQIEVIEDQGIVRAEAGEVRAAGIGDDGGLSALADLAEHGLNHLRFSPARSPCNQKVLALFAGVDGNVGNRQPQIVIGSSLGFDPNQPCPTQDLKAKLGGNVHMAFAPAQARTPGQPAQRTAGGNFRGGRADAEENTESCGIAQLPELSPSWRYSWTNRPAKSKAASQTRYSIQT